MRLLAWTADLISTYGIDGVRIDTVPYVPKQFWRRLTHEALNGTYAVGEVLISDKPLSYIAGYQQSPAAGDVLDAVLNYPLFFALRDAFMTPDRDGGGLGALATLIRQEQAAFRDWSALGVFLDNHDQPRFLLAQPDRTLYRNG